MYANVRMLADDGHLLAQVDAVFEVGYPRVSFANLVENCGGLQPLSQSLLTHAGADGAQELKQAGFAEEIQVSSVNVAWVVELFALPPGAGPAVLHPGEAFSIEISGALGAGSCPAGGLVGYDQCGECRYAWE
jgi:hypothetical protein